MIDSEVFLSPVDRDHIVNLVLDDQRTRGEGRVALDDAPWAMDRLNRVVLGGERLRAHIALLEQLYQGKFRRFASMRDRRSDESVLPDGPDAAFLHHAWLHEEQVLAIAECGPEALRDAKLFPEGFALAAARLLLNPYALWDLSDLVNCVLPPYWLEQMEQHGEALAAELGIDLSLRTPLTSMLDEETSQG